MGEATAGRVLKRDQLHRGVSHAVVENNVVRDSGDDTVIEGAGYPGADGDPDTCRESAVQAFPQSLTMDLDGATSVTRLVLRSPPSPARTETIAVEVCA